MAFELPSPEPAGGGFDWANATPVASPAQPQGGGGGGGFDMDAEIEAAAKANNVPPHIFHGLVKQESNFDPYVVSPAGAAGLAQLMPDTATGLGVKDVFDPRENLHGGAKYFRQMLDMFGGDERVALAAYNAGPAHPQTWGPTQVKYADNVMANADAYQAKQGAGTPPPESTGGKPFVVGDSLANGLRGQGFPGDATDGIPPAAVLYKIRQHRKEIAGQDVVLSSGVSNAPGQFDFVQRQINALKSAGAKSITMMGVGSRPDLAPFNDRLSQVAQQNGVRFMGPVAGAVHPDAGYGDMAKAAMPQATGSFDWNNATPVTPPVAFDWASAQPVKPNFPVNLNAFPGKPMTNAEATATLPMAQTGSDKPPQTWTEFGPIEDQQVVPQGPSGTSKILGAASEAYRNTPDLLTPLAQKYADAYGLGNDARLIGMVIKGFNAAWVGASETANQIGVALGMPTLGRDAAAMIESAGMTGAPHVPMREALTAARETPRSLTVNPIEPRGGKDMTPGPPAATGEQARGFPLEPGGSQLNPEAMRTLEASATAPIPQITVTAKAPTPEERLPPEDLPPVPEGHTRVYHGGDNANSGGPRWVTPNYNYARDYRQGQPVWYADVPNNHPALQAATDHTAVEGTGMAAPIHSFEAPADIAARMRPVDTTPTAPEGHPETGVHAQPEVPPAPEPLSNVKQTPYETVPRAPMRLNTYLQRPSIESQGTPMERKVPGGIKDEGGDLKAILGGTNVRPGLINNKTGRSWNDALIHAWEGGYLPDYPPGGPPPTDFRALQEAMRDDHSGTPRYSLHDQEAAADYHNALNQNSEIDRLAAEHGIPIQGMTRPMFYDALNAAYERMSVAERDAQIGQREHDFLEAQHDAESWGSGRDFYGQSQARSLEDLEREYSQEGAPPSEEQRAEGAGEPGPARPSTSVIQEDEGPRGHPAGPTGRTEAGEAGQEAPPAHVVQGALADAEFALKSTEDLRRRERGDEPTVRNDPNQNVMPGMEPSAVQAQAARDAQGRGALQTDVAQKKADEGLFAPDTSGQSTLYSGGIFDPDAWKRFFSPLPPRQQRPTQQPPGGMFAPRQPPRQNVPPQVQAAQMAVAARYKNLNAIEKYTILPQTLASLDEPSARFWNEWTRREDRQAANLTQLRGTIQQSFLKLPDASRERVYGALELARVAPGEVTVDAAGNVTARNATVPFARKSQVGDALTLTPEESRAYQEMLQLGKDQWNMVMQGAATRYGWGGAMDPAAIRQAALAATTPAGHKRLTRLADLIDAMRTQAQDAYFPMMRFGSQYIAIRAKQGAGTVVMGGGHPPLVWFDTVEKPWLQNVLGREGGWQSVQQAAQNRITELQQQFPPNRYDITTGDFAKKPALLRNMDIPAIEKLMMLMESGVQREIRQRIMQQPIPGGPTTPQGIRSEAKRQYEQLYGKTVEAFYDELFKEMKAGYRKKASVVPGYSPDFDRAVATHMYQIARNSADTVHHDAIESAYSAVTDYHPHRDTIGAYWKGWRDYQENPDSLLGRGANQINKLGFAYVMGMNPSSTIIMATHTPLAAAPVLSVGIGWKPAFAAMTKGLGEGYRAVRFDPQHGGTVDVEAGIRGMPPAKQAFMRQMAAEGRLEAVGAQDMARLNEKPSMLLGNSTPYWRRGLDWATTNIHTIDQANRFGVASAAFELASDPAKLNAMATPLMQHDARFRDMVQTRGLSPDTFGRFMLSQAAFEWGKENRAPWQQNWLGTLGGSLHGFQTRYLSTALRLAKNSGPEGRMGAVFMYAALATGAGVIGATPFIQDIGNGYDNVMQKITGENPQIGMWLRDAMDGFSHAGTRIVLDGPASWLAGVDTAGRIGFGDPITREWDPGNVMGTVPVIVWRSIQAAAKRREDNQPAAAVASEVVPYAARGTLRGIAAAQQGVKSRTGTQIVSPEDVSRGDIARMATGFTPETVTAAMRERTRYYKTQEGEPAARDLLKQAKAAAERGNDDDAMRMREEATKKLHDMGWSAFRIKSFKRGVMGGHLDRQFNRFEERRGATPGALPAAP